jgi:hypothetical protein
MGDAWFTGIEDELARCLADAGACADACERLLDNLGHIDDAGLRQRVLDAAIAPAAVARTLVDVLDEPRLVLAAAQLCRDSALHAATVLEALDAAEAITALRTAAASCQRLLDAAPDS